jgi:hypothetical protein
MPAIQLSFLRSEIAQLAQEFPDPPEFQRHLAELFESHATLVYRSGQTVQPVRQIKAYHLPPLVISSIDNYLAPLCSSDPNSALAVVDTLWGSDYLEQRQLAASLLGHVPPSPPDRITARLIKWCQPPCEEVLLETMLDAASRRLRHEMPILWLQMVENWLNEKIIFYQKTGLKALQPLIQDREYENLPPVYRLLEPVVRAAPPVLIGELQVTLQTLVQRSPGETAFFIQRILLTEAELTSGTMRLARRLLPKFPPDIQTNLRSLLKGTPPE